MRRWFPASVPRPREATNGRRLGGEGIISVLKEYTAHEKESKRLTHAKTRLDGRTLPTTDPTRTPMTQELSQNPCKFDSYPTFRLTCIPGSENLAKWQDSKNTSCQPALTFVCPMSSKMPTRVNLIENRTRRATSRRNDTSIVGIW